MKHVSKILVAAAFAALSTTALAMVEDDVGINLPAGGFGGNGVNGMGLDSWDSGAVSFATLDKVQVIGSKCPQFTICLYGDFSLSLIYTGILTLPLDSGSGGGGSSPENPITPEDKAKCVSNCDTTNNLRVAACNIAADNLRQSIAYREWVGPILGGAAGYIADKTSGMIAGAAYSFASIKEANTKIVSDNLSGCLAESGQMYTFCVHTKCHASLALPFAFIPLVRRRREERTTT